ncbi:MAG TPA: hypothetical protein V6C81_16060 [Planktothrix sp.]|jgi:hypothetical protein
MNARRFTLTLLLTGAATTFGATAAPAADWGYDDGKKPATAATPAPAAEGLKAAPAASLFARPQAPVKPQVKPAATAKKPAQHAGTKSGAKAPSGSSQDAVDDWIALYDMASKEPLAEEQKERIRTELQHKLASDQRADVMSILSFWPATEKEIESNDQQKKNFAALFRALLRFQSKSKNLNSDDGEILPEVLGPERIALPGDPPLGEEAVDAYADMACFMYEQRHPGKSVDAVDNRAIFASVICQKYSNAPTPTAKKAMANFALSWARFRIGYDAAGEEQKQKLLSSLEAGSRPEVNSAGTLVEQILQQGPWAHAHI